MCHHFKFDYKAIRDTTQGGAQRESSRRTFVRVNRFVRSVYFYFITVYIFVFAQFNALWNRCSSCLFLLER